MPIANLELKNSPTPEQRKEAEGRRKKPRSLARRLIGTVLYILFIFGLVYATPKLLSKWLNSDYPMAAITSGSMWPTLKRGDLIFIEGLDPRTVAVNEIVVYQNEKGAFTIHRVVEVNEVGVVTKGDANNVTDLPIPYESIIGRLYKFGQWNARIPKLGFISTTFSGLVQSK